jgi:transposase
MRRAYQTDLSDAEWCYIEPLIPVPKAPGRPRVHTLREILNAIFYIVRSGCAWRLLPHDFPPWKTVYHNFRRWRIDGTWERMYAALRERLRARMRGRTGSLVAATASPNLPLHPLFSTAQLTTSGLLLEQLCADVQRGPHSAPRPSPPNLYLSLHPCKRRPATSVKGAGTSP